jgi:hypothetical protein
MYQILGGLTRALILLWEFSFKKAVFLEVVFSLGKPTRKYQ